ncbi:reverse transcriptase [Plakobranchus ocellatus]|uniref:Reverse transcriptase n=1 Tax=Plakobranchus ocellatus TaxID=259542 RepID=A0AAV4AX34_9GAST|nr:reverse transcriptase [Plakobranchus ocellatus]
MDYPCICGRRFFIEKGMKIHKTKMKCLNNSKYRQQRSTQVDKTLENKAKAQNQHAEEIHASDPDDKFSLVLRGYGKSYPEQKSGAQVQRPWRWILHAAPEGFHRHHHGSVLQVNETRRMTVRLDALINCQEPGKIVWLIPERHQALEEKDCDQREQIGGQNKKSLYMPVLYNKGSQRQRGNKMIVLLLLIVCASSIQTTSTTVTAACQQVRNCYHGIIGTTFSFLFYPGGDLDGYITNTICNYSRLSCALEVNTTGCSNVIFEKEAKIAYNVAKYLCENSAGAKAIKRVVSSSPCKGNLTKFNAYIAHRTRCEHIGYRMSSGQSDKACRLAEKTKTCDMRYASHICGKVSLYLSEMSWVIRVNWMYPNILGYSPRPSRSTLAKSPNNLGLASEPAQSWFRIRRFPSGPKNINTMVEQQRGMDSR